MNPNTPSTRGKGNLLSPPTEFDDPIPAHLKDRDAEIDAKIAEVERLLTERYDRLYPEMPREHPMRRRTDR
jgi:hypothetical protein